MEVDYKEMYLKMVRATEETMNILIPIGLYIALWGEPGAGPGFAGRIRPLRKSAYESQTSGSGLLVSASSIYRRG